MKTILSLLLLIFLLPSLSLATEPPHCSAAYFNTHELTQKLQGIERLHLYQLPHTKLAGLAIGDSSVKAVEALSTSPLNRDPKYCTYYFNDGNKAASDTFHYHPILHNPVMTSSPSEFDEKVTPLLPEFVECMAVDGYLAIGCDGMKHRGPSVFSMLLALSGCSPERSTAIVEYVWGTNWVSTSTRIGIAKLGYEYGNTHPALRLKLQRMFND